MSADQVTKFTAKETAALIRKALRTAFPGAKISVTMSRGTGHGYMHTTWTDGPTTKMVEEAVGHFRSATFDGMTDSTNHLPPQPVVVDGVPQMVAYTCYGFGTQRRTSPEAVAWSQDVMAAAPGKFEYDRDPVGSDGVNHSAAHRILAQVDLTDGFPDAAETARSLSSSLW